MYASDRNEGNRWTCPGRLGWVEESIVSKKSLKKATKCSENCKPVWFRESGTKKNAGEQTGDGRKMMASPGEQCWLIGSRLRESHQTKMAWSCFKTLLVKGCQGWNYQAWRAERRFIDALKDNIKKNRRCGYGGTGDLLWGSAKMLYCL